MTIQSYSRKRRGLRKLSNSEVAIPKGLKAQQEGIKETRELLDRYAKGRRMFQEAMAKSDLELASKLLTTFDKVLEETYLSTERVLMLQEYLATGKAVVIPRDGTKPYKVDNPEQYSEFVAASPYELQCIRALSETFKEDTLSFVEFDRLK